MDSERGMTQNLSIQVKETPKKGTYVQVPSSSPILVQSSPEANKDHLVPPSMFQMKNSLVDMDKEKKLEAKRQAIRNHKDFPMVKRRFYYLQESDIFKGFVKGKGNLRDITQWLEENYNKHEILAKHETEKKRQRQMAQDERLKHEEERMRDHHARLQAMKQWEATQNGAPESIKNDAAIKNSNFDDLSHLKNDSSEAMSTKVLISKPKVSILDKYKYKPKNQYTLDLDGSRDDNDQNKKRKLVNTSGNYMLPSRLPSISTLRFNEPNAVKYSRSAGRNSRSKSHEMEVNAEDDLDLLEAKIKENRRAAKARSRVASVSDDELEDDVVSDDMSDDDDNKKYNSGLTSIDSQILEFLNNASQQDIAEIGNVPPKTSNLIISERPFYDLYLVAQKNFDSEGTSDDGSQKKPKRRGGQRKALGQKLIENIEFSLKGYRAVDSLIKQCSQYGSLISKQMEAWGVSVDGSGELEMTDIEVTETPIPIGDNRNSNVNYDDDDDDDIVIVRRNNKLIEYIKEKPKLLADNIELKNYQQVGINWLNLLYKNNLSCILADEMGLGKTCQVIAFMAYIKETDPNCGQSLVIVPSSTLENWLREFRKFCPSLRVQAYYGSQREREDLRYDLQDSDFDILVTTYNLATGAAPDFKFLRSINFNMIIYDEGHMLKNSTSERYNKLMRLSTNFRLLLTGTPLQNNLKELVSLLSFMLPDLFHDRRDDLQGLFNQKVSTTDTHEENYNPLLSVQAITKAKTMMTPFVLRRKKVQVLKHLPEKVHQILKCEMTKTQAAIYNDYLSQGKRTRIERERRKNLSQKEQERARKVNIPSSSNVMMSLRKAALHPLLFRTLYNDKKIESMAKAIMREPEYVDANRDYIIEDMKVMCDYELNNLCERFSKSLGKYSLSDEEYLNSGKISKLVEILLNVIERKEKILVFSLFTQMLDILERVLTIHKIKFLRLDGQTSVDTRQDLIDKFYEDDTIPVFLLSTKAGGFGINLVAANNVLIFDQSFNPHDDKQAEDRAHRVGQTNTVSVTKLIMEDTIEVNMSQLAENKLQLDESISNNDMNDAKFEEKTAAFFEKLLFA